MRVVTALQMKEIEKRGNASGLSYLQMMENAGAAAYHIIRSRYPSALRFLVFCGKGNNGGDGFVVARLLAEAGLYPTVVLVEGKPVTDDATTNYRRLPKHIPVQTVSDPLPICDVMIDALYGTGFHGSLRPAGATACRAMSGATAPVAALDVPSGCSADTGTACDGAVCADVTIVFDSWKHVHYPPSPQCGQCILADIGIPEHCHNFIEEL